MNYDWPHLTGKLATKLIACLPLASMSAAEMERVKEVLVEIDRMEQRGLKAEALTREAQQDVANLDKQCSEIALNHGREIERLLVEIDRMEAQAQGLKHSIDYRLNEHLCGMKPNWDDSIVGFNEAWDIVRGVFVRAALGGKDGKR